MDKDNSFNIDGEPIPKKRNYNYIKSDLINKLYEGKKFQLKPLKKKINNI
jgi:hypothetical protein